MKYTVTITAEAKEFDENAEITIASEHSPNDTLSILNFGLVSFLKSYIEQRCESEEELTKFMEQFNDVRKRGVKVIDSIEMDHLLNKDEEELQEGTPDDVNVNIDGENSKANIG